MTPGNQSDAVRVGAGLLAKSRRFRGAFDDRLVDDLHRNDRGGVQGSGDLLGIGGHLFEGVRPVEVLAAGDEPNLKLFQVEHRRRVNCRQIPVKSKGSWEHNNGRISFSIKAKNIINRSF